MLRHAAGLAEVMFVFPCQHIRRYGCDQLQADRVRLFTHHETVDIQGAFIREDEGAPDPVLEVDIGFVFEPQASLRDIQDLEFIPFHDKSGAPVEPVADAGKFAALCKGVFRGLDPGRAGSGGNVFNDDGHEKKNHGDPGDKPGEKIGQPKEKRLVQPDDKGPADDAGTCYVQDLGAHGYYPLFRWRGLTGGRTEVEMPKKILP